MYTVYHLSMYLRDMHKEMPYPHVNLGSFGGHLKVANRGTSMQEGYFRGGVGENCEALT
jgi:hypothetical protein